MSWKFFSHRALFISFLLIFFMTAMDVPPFMGLFAFVIFVWKWLSERNYSQGRRLPRIHRRLTALISLILPGFVYLQYRTIIGLEPSSTLLLGLASLKIMDYENERDHKFLILLGFVMVAIKPIFSLDFYWVLPSIVAFAGLWYSLLSTSLSRPAVYLVRVLLLSMPMALILFFAFPRLVVPWAMSQSSGTSQAGFSDQLNPGSVAELASVDAVAFRARFLSGHVASQNLYWRGSVLSVSDGLRWQPRRLPLAEGHTENKKASGLLSYEIILEPGSERYFFTLNKAWRVESALPVLEYAHQVFRATVPVTHNLTYRAVSDPAEFDTEIPDKKFLQFPPLSPKAASWVQEVSRRSRTVDEKLTRLKEFFADPTFVYTLKPGTYKKDDLDAFLFERKKGFCEHFAGAYATLARALGIPSRVVVGYQGGFYNPLGDFWKISQRDAHAWVEVFQQGQWQRQDPTEWVAPLRLTLGADGFFALSLEQQQNLARTANWRPVAGSNDWWNNISFWIDDLNYRWNYFLTDFDSEAQKSIWTQISQNLKFFFFVVLLLLGLFVFIYRKTRHLGEGKSELERLGANIARWAATHGSTQKKHEAPLTFWRRLAQEFPESAEFFGALADAYDREVYAGEKASSDGPRLRRRWRELQKHLG